MAIAPAAYIHSSTCAKVVHYRTEDWKRDPVTRIDKIGSVREAGTIVALPSHPNAPLHDHSFTSPTYQRGIMDAFETYASSGGKTI